MTTYLARDEWTSTDASGVELTGAELVGVAVHWPGTGAPVIGVESQADTASRLRGYRNFHVTGRGWRDIGYNVTIDQAGRVWLCRSTSWGVDMVGAHCASASNPRANHKYVGVLLLVGAEEAPSAAMREAFADWYHTRFLRRWPMRTDVRGHGEVPGARTTCPGALIRADIANGALTTEDGMTPEEMAEIKAYIDQATDPRRILEVSLHPDTPEPRMSQYGWDHGSAGGTPNPRVAKLIGYIWGNTRDALIVLAALREVVGMILERGPGTPLTRADLDEAIELGMQKVRLEIAVVDREAE